jgi:hypothetical protein
MQPADVVHAGECPGHPQHPVIAMCREFEALDRTCQEKVRVSGLIDQLLQQIKEIYALGHERRVDLQHRRYTSPLQPTLGHKRRPRKSL